MESTSLQPILTGDVRFLKTVPNGKATVMRLEGIHVTSFFLSLRVREEHIISL